MHKCLFCGYENPSEKAKFCVECGPVGPASGWESRDIDQPENVRAYLMAIGELFFEADSNTAITKGIVALLVRVLSGQSAKEITSSPLQFIDRINLRSHLSSQQFRR